MTELPPPVIPLITRKIIDASLDIQEIDCDNPQFLHSVLCQVALPRKRTTERVFERRSGTAGVRIEAGALHSASKGFTEMPLPYGSRSRLILIHLCSEAIRTKSRCIELGNSTRDFMLKLGIQDNGQEYKRFRQQMEALAACRMVLGYSTPQKSVTINTQPITRFEAWASHDGKQPGLWPGYLEISQEFLDTVLGFAVPLDPRAIATLKHSALGLDIYSWLAHRLHRVRQPNGAKVSWSNLKEQFGQEYKISKDFKKEFRKELRKVHAVYSHAQIEDEVGGLRLFPSPPPIQKTKTLVPFSSSKS